MRHQINHPTEPRTSAVVGHDHAVGWFADLMKAGRVVQSYAGVPGQMTTTVVGVLRFLIHHGFFRDEDAEDAMRQLQVVELDDISDEDSRRAAELLVALKLGAGE